MRKFIRHPSDIPISITVENKHTRSPLRDISEGGLSFFNAEHLPIGTRITLSIPVYQDNFSANGIVIWSKKTGYGFETGVRFEDSSTEYAVRMVEQVCHIEQYRKDIYKNENRKLSSQEAAQEWISNNAGNFPD